MWELLSISTAREIGYQQEIGESSAASAARAQLRIMHACAPASLGHRYANHKNCFGLASRFLSDLAGEGEENTASHDKRKIPHAERP